MATENRPSRSPAGRGQEFPYLAQVADLVVSNSSLKPTTAMKRVMRSRNHWGASDETLLRRWQVKWKANHKVYLAAALKSQRRAAAARSSVETLRKWDELIKALQNSPTLRQWDEAFKALQNSPTLRQWDEAFKALQNSPTLRRWSEAFEALQNSPTLRRWSEAFKALQNSPTLRRWSEAFKALQNSPTLRQWNEAFKALQNSPAWKGIDGYRPLRLPVGGIRA